uniref:Uncharacterized protein n=1 Tax=Plectus sambesii TaxID=2011161 RepID=A0A914X260_9BILA
MFRLPYTETRVQHPAAEPPGVRHATADREEHQVVKGSKAKELGDGNKLFYNGGLSGRNGVGIIVCVELKDKVVDVQRFSDRLMLVKQDMKEGLVNIISAYAPQAGCSSDDKADFWHLLDGVMQSVLAEEQVLVLEDLNGHLVMARPGYEHVHGGHAIGNRNQE